MEPATNGDARLRSQPVFPLLLDGLEQNYLGINPTFETPVYLLLPPDQDLKIPRQADDGQTLKVRRIYIPAHPYQAFAVPGGDNVLTTRLK